MITNTRQGQKERAILFSGPMIRAILENRKTQTRRVIKPQPPEWFSDSDAKCSLYAPTKVDRDGELYPGPEVFGFYNEDQGWPCPYGMPGSGLWVRETHFISALSLKHQIFDRNNTWYRATDELPPHLTKWRSSIYMPRWASRITLEIVSVRVERLQEVSEEDVVAEGVGLTSWCAGRDWPRTAGFAQLWDSLNARRGYGWSVNPWVWVIEFKRLLSNAEAKSDTPSSNPKGDSE